MKADKRMNQTTYPLIRCLSAAASFAFIYTELNF
jgi:hypothetical protein